MHVDQTISVLGRAIDSTEHPLSAEFAREILKWQLSAADHQKMNALIAKSRSVGMTEEEKNEFEQLCRVGDILALLRLRAREALGEFNTAGA